MADDLRPLVTGDSSPMEAVAVVGAGCVFPDAPDVPSFWENLRQGRCSIGEVPTERWDQTLFYSPDRSAPDKAYSRIGAFVRSQVFDWRKFRIPPNTVKAMDRAQIWALEAAHQALTDARVDSQGLDRSRCAVIVGACGSEETRVPTALRVYRPLVRRLIASTNAWKALDGATQTQLLQEFDDQYNAHFPPVTEDSMPGELANIIAGRVANLFDLGGKNFVTDAACASSMAALDTAVKSLLTHESDAVLAGGADHNLCASMYVKFSRLGALSARGSFPFDKRADGFVMGEGAGMVLLKRLSDARRAGDRIRAVVRGVGSSSDGRGKGIVAPNPEGQRRAIECAYAAARLPPGDVDYVECHGTATPTGDVAEIQALTAALGANGRAPGSIGIGSVKSNIGHTISAAGAASLLKTVLALEHRFLPASLGFEKPNPHLGLDRTPFYVVNPGKPWPDPTAPRPRRAGVSCFGFGGTNFHAVLEEAPAARP